MISSSLRPVAAALLLCVAAFTAGCNRTPAYSSDPETAATAFFTTLEKGDAKAAYDSAAFNFKAGQTYEAFLSNARLMGLLSGPPPVWSDKTINGSETSLKTSITTPNGVLLNLIVKLSLEDSQWKIFDLSIRSRLGTILEPFSLVGKGGDFNDVYHQPMPTHDQLIGMVQSTLTAFNDAVRAGDFHKFYDGVSSQWKNGQWQSGKPTQPITPTILKTHFQTFIDAKVDVSNLKNRAPVFDRPPTITPDGLLDLNGHYDSTPARIVFSLQYVYEMPRWRLFGINIMLTK